eukprot:CAMPEP_0184677712 /NCGR_PEP_ID=MMETSP0312-20130426/293_1 /TAXON_ID=31354 /ORGANISM="Compsopogon coeruleus, Strain SAG 36.94" /LENGTH=183 /DNA_ID=CAMNT_0027125731 /DNA_START=1075 /DNA_END=1626 /DNA_ORIENTATION=+
MNFAATLNCPVLFLCRNNGYAISTPASEQYRGDGIVRRGTGYGVDALRIDGSDLWAVYTGVLEARKRVVDSGRPFLVELMTYREGHHSTSDDSDRYRSASEIERFRKIAHPVKRTLSFLSERGWWSIEDDKKFIETEKSLIMAALERAEKLPKPAVEDMFQDVYDSLTPNLIMQRDDVLIREK